MSGANVAIAQSGERWFLVNAQTGSEHLAGEHLRRQGYAPFIPASWRSIRHARKIRTVKAAYFPGYLFVPLDLDRDRWRAIDGTVGVLRIVKAGQRPLAAPVGLVESIIAMTGVDAIVERARGLEPGASVRVTCGPFADQLAVVERLGSADRVRVLLSLMNQIVPVELRRDHLAVA